MTESKDELRANRRTLLLIVATPLVVILASSILYFMVDRQWLDLGEANRGVLVSPPLQIDTLSLYQADESDFNLQQSDPRWTYLIVGDGPCEKACERSLYITGQTHKLLGKKVNKVQRVYLQLQDGSKQGLTAAFLDMLATEHPRLRVAVADRAAVESVLAPTLDWPLPKNRFYLIDPRGWLMMYYDADSDDRMALSLLSKDMIKDIKRLIP